MVCLALIVATAVEVSQAPNDEQTQWEQQAQQEQQEQEAQSLKHQKAVLEAQIWNTAIALKQCEDGIDSLERQLRYLGADELGKIILYQEDLKNLQAERDSLYQKMGELLQEASKLGFGGEASAIINQANKPPETGKEKTTDDRPFWEVWEEYKKGRR